MFTHIMVGSNDFEKSKAFYDAALGALGVPAGQAHNGRAFYSHDGGNFGVGAPADGNNATHANGGTIGFKAPSQEAVDAFHAAGKANGGTCEGEPGIRNGGGRPMYGAYLRDPDGNKVCAFASPNE
jgi:catechol 2,3-dioxygenase-like lactoylglutathione lyase family enzyme